MERADNLRKQVDGFRLSIKILIFASHLKLVMLRPPLFLLRLLCRKAEKLGRETCVWMKQRRRETLRECAMQLVVRISCCWLARAAHMRQAPEDKHQYTATHNVQLTACVSLTFNECRKWRYTIADEVIWAAKYGEIDMRMIFGQLEGLHVHPCQLIVEIFEHVIVVRCDKHRLDQAAIVEISHFLNTSLDLLHNQLLRWHANVHREITMLVHVAETLWRWE